MRCGGAAVAWRVVQVWLDAIGAKGLRLRGVEWQAACEVQPWHGVCSGPGARARFWRSWAHVQLVQVFCRCRGELIIPSMPRCGNCGNPELYSRYKLAIMKS